MPIEFRCTRCQNPMQRPDHMAGKKATCPKCNTINAVPHGAEAPAVTAAPPAAPIMPAVAAPPAPRPTPPAPASAAPQPAARPAPAQPVLPAAEPRAEVPRVAAEAAPPLIPKSEVAPTAAPRKPPAPPKPVAPAKPQAPPQVEAPPQPVTRPAPPPVTPPIPQARPAPPPAPKPAPTTLEVPAVVGETGPAAPLADPKPASPTPPAPKKSAAPVGRAKKLSTTLRAAEAVDTPEAENEELAGPRWENRGLGPGNYLITIFQVWFQPSRTFRHLREDAGMMPATWFMFVGLALSGYVHGLALFFLSNNTLDQFGLKELSIFIKVTAHDEIGAVLLTSVLTLTGSLLVMGWYYLQASLINSILRSLGASVDSVEYTYRVLALVQGATGWIGIIPLLGPPLLVVVQPPLQTLCLAPAAGVTRVRALLAVGLTWCMVLFVGALFWVSLLVMNSEPTLP